MNRPRMFWPLLLAVLAPAAAVAADDAPSRSPREALQAFNDLIGSWRGTGEPNGTREEKQKGFWQESIAWQWQFKGDDAWLQAAIEKGKYFTAAELHYLPDGDRYQLTLHTVAKEELVFKGTLADRRLTVERTDDKTGEAQRLVVSLLHSNRYLFRYDVKPADHAAYTQVYQVGVTKEGGVRQRGRGAGVRGQRRPRHDEHHLQGQDLLLLLHRLPRRLRRQPGEVHQGV